MIRRSFTIVSALASLAGLARADGIAGTPHNLSVSGPGPVRATTETQICVFCHTPHDANPSGPLWNHQLSSGVTYLKYTSPSLVAYTSQAGAPDPNGATKLCLSCHDGTVALGAVLDRTAQIALEGGKVQLTPADVGYIGTDLSKTHPLSFVVTDQLIATKNTNNPDMSLQPRPAMKSDPDVHLDGLDRVQCTACHNPHNDANFATSGVHFYNKPGRADTCVVCHASPAVDQGPHLQALAVAASSSAPRDVGTALGSTTSVVASALAAANASAQPGVGKQAEAHGDAQTLPQRCMSCHVSHASDEGRRALLLGRDEDACYRCHGPGSAQERRDGRLAPDARPVDVMLEFQKPSHHPIEFPGDHKPNERTPETNPNARRHVLCVDCHDAHGTRTRQASAPGAGAKLSSIRRFATEAEMCFLCHGPAANRPARQPDVARQFSSTSYHPVLGPGRGSRVPSLVAPLTTASVIACTDCHGNDNPSGPAGPHGSLYAPLLVRADQHDDGQPESPARYDLCYRCHDRNSILSDVSFPFHRKHVVEQRTPCSACHSAHGADTPSLVQFDPAIVQPNAKGLRSFASLGGGGAQCYLSCHGATHDPASYCGPGLPCPQTLRAAARQQQVPLSPIPPPESLFPGWPTP